MGLGKFSRSYGLMIILVLLVLVIMESPARSGAAETWKRSLKTIPPVLASRLSPLNPISTAKLIAQLRSFQNLSAFCDEAGFLCNQNTHLAPVQLHAFTSYTHTTDNNDSVSYNSTFMNLHNINPNDLYFGENQLFLGSRLKLFNPLKPVDARAFLPRALERELRPLFSLKNLPKLLQLFGFSHSSNMAINMEQTLTVCEAQARQGEIKACVSSMEQMVDFATSISGTRDLRVLTGANIESNPAASSINSMVTLKGLIEMDTSRGGAVACHNAMFPYQVFYCHYLQSSKVFKAQLQTQEGKLISTTVSCHGLQPELTHEMVLHANLKIKPNELICHWNFGDNLVWIPASPVVSNI